MRRMLSACVLLCLLLSLWGCHYNSQLKDPVNFYYPLHPDYFEEHSTVDGAIAAEAREASGHVGDLDYLLTLYLGGPLDEALVSPFPSGTRLQKIFLDQDTLVVSLNENYSQLSGMDLTLACACISATCFELSDVSQVTIISPETELYSAVSLTMTRESLMLIDNVPVSSEGKVE